ncbi:MAG TPA: hypothetical protein PLF26_14055 [Blastocatellia bacterium]|nr:hypothetical protein [Blastocatellia bacterium]
MADLLGLAKMTLQASRPKPYIDTTGQSDDDQRSGPVSGLIRDALADPSGGDATLLLMLTGEAGAGKTSVLQELVRAQADLYCRGQVESLFLYVNAQGRALARFTEAVAAELDDLRSLLTFHQVTPLVRLGLIVPIVDGFDELLGVGGYAEAFNSLASFIEELDGTGQIIASARSTYYEQEFLSRAGRASALGTQSWRQVAVRVSAWGPNELDRFVEARTSEQGLPSAEIVRMQHEVAAVFSGRNQSLRSKPLFVAQVLELVLLGHKFAEGQDLLESLVSAYVKREQTEKLVDRAGKPILASDQIRGLLVELAEEMWNQETREMDARSARELAEFVLLDSDLSASAKQQVVERMPSMAFLALGERRSTITFEHETFFAYFLAQRLADRLFQAPTSLPILLGRSVLPEEVAKLAVDRIREANDDDVPIAGLIKTLGNAGGVLSPRQVQVQENAGLVARYALRAACRNDVVCSGLDVRNITFPGGDLAEVQIAQSAFTNVEFRRVDLRRTQIIGADAENVLVLEVMVDPSWTRLELSGMDVESSVYGLRFVDARGLEVSTFDPEEIGKLLVAVGTIPAPPPVENARNVAPHIRDLLERFVRAYKKANPLCTSDDFLATIFHDRAWAGIQRELTRAGVITEEFRATSGRPKQFLRRQVLPEEILAGIDRRAKVPSQVRAFWDAIEDR